ncbi:MAG TPA: GNAT family N-acetyltransferase [Methanomassiliicoccales archaeon]|nr:GNAT family N-acetyltransferase [Methanomassiliicoccales archaeon]
MSVSGELLAKRSPLAPDLGALVDEAFREVAAIANECDRKRLSKRLEQIRSGGFDLVVVRDRANPAGFLAFEKMDDEAMLRYGHVSSACDLGSETILVVAIEALEREGINSVFSLFNWPQRDALVRAADSLGFARVDRKNMIRNPDSPPIRHSLPPGIEIASWKQEFLEMAAGVLFENSYPEDRTFHRPYRTREGCLAYVEAVTNGRYGEFKPDLSQVALHEDKLVGLLLTSRLPGVHEEIEDLAVDRPFRGQGIATALIGVMIEASAATSNNQIVLTVTSSNTRALSLYQRLGFEVTEEVTYFTHDSAVRRTNQLL